MIDIILVFYVTWRLKSNYAIVCSNNVFIYFRKYFIPGTSAFVAEFLVMLGVYGSNSLASLICAIATIFGAHIICGYIIDCFLVL